MTAPDNTCLLTTHQLSVTFNEKFLLRDISIKLASGKICAVVGPNGAGKSTLLKTISGEIVTYSGEIQFGGKSSGRNNTDQAKSLAVLPQLHSLNFSYTVEEVVALGRIPHSTGRKLDEEITRQAMQLLDIAHLAQQKYTEISGGEKQRTQLARVMVQIWRGEDAKQRLLLLDEPTNSLDLAHQQILMEAVSNFSAQGVGVLMVVHDINIAIKYADDIVALSKGRCIFQGDINEVLRESQLKQIFGVDLSLIRHPKTDKFHVIL